MPNCSEIICRLEGTTFSVSTDGFPNGCIDAMMDILSKMKNPETAEILGMHNNGGGGDSEYVENCLELAKKAVQNNLSPEQIAELDEKLWHGEELEQEEQEEQATIK